MDAIASEVESADGGWADVGDTSAEAASAC